MAASLPGARTPMRRRQRSVRVTGSVALLAVAAVAVLASLPTRSALWLGLAAVIALGLSWSSVRLMWTEVLESRRDNAADRAAAAAAYRTLFAARAAEHAAFTTAMTERLAQAHLSQRELEGLIVQHETRAQRAESKLLSESQALVETREQVLALEEALTVLREAWPDGPEAGDSVVDLVAWDEQVQKAGKRAARTDRPALKQA